MAVAMLSRAYFLDFRKALDKKNIWMYKKEHPCYTA